MKFALLCDNFFQRKISFFQKKSGDSNGNLNLVDIPGHEISIITAENFLQNPSVFDDFSCIIVERGTWQKNFSTFRYFGLLSILEGKKLIFVLSSPDIELKGRVGIRRKEFIIPDNVCADEITLLLNKFSEAQPFSYTHPKSGAVA